MEDELPYDVFGTGDKSVLPGRLVERILGPSSYPVRIKIIMDYVKANKENFKIVMKE